MSRPGAGSIVLVEWRGRRQPDEPGGIRPAVVVENSDLFADSGYRNVLVVPLSRDSRFSVMSALVERIAPSAENGADEDCWAIAHHISSVALARVRETESRITQVQLDAIRAKVALAIGADC